jgi:hypothetical protein
MILCDDLTILILLHKKLNKKTMLFHDNKKITRNENHLFFFIMNAMLKN